MLNANDVARVYDTILSIPGMNESVRIDMKISRKNILLLNTVIRRGLGAKEDDKSPGLLTGLPEETIRELNAIAEEYLNKAGLTDLSGKLDALGSK